MHRCRLFSAHLWAFVETVRLYQENLDRIAAVSLDAVAALDDSTPPEA